MIIKLWILKISFTIYEQKHLVDYNSWSAVKNVNTFNHLKEHVRQYFHSSIASDDWFQEKGGNG